MTRHGAARCCLTTHREVQQLKRPTMVILLAAVFTPAVFVYEMPHDSRNDFPPHHYTRSQYDLHESE